MSILFSFPVTPVRCPYSYPPHMLHNWLYVPEQIAQETLPTLLERWGLSPEWIKNHQDHVAYTLHHLFLMRVHNPLLGPHDYCLPQFDTLHRLILGDVLVKIQELLLQHQVIEADRLHSLSPYSRGYRWHARYRRNSPGYIHVTQDFFALQLAVWHQFSWDQQTQQEEQVPPYLISYIY